MSASTPSGTVGYRNVERYLGPAEEVAYVTRRRAKVLDGAIGLWLAALAFYVGAVALPQPPTFQQASLGLAVFGATSLFLMWKGLSWWTARCVFTTERVLVVEGVLSRKVDEIPLQLVIDAMRLCPLPQHNSHGPTIIQQQSFGGHLPGHGHVEPNLSGDPGLRMLEWLPDHDRAYELITDLGDRHNPAISGPASTETAAGEEGWEPWGAMGEPVLLPLGRRPG